MNDAPSQSRPVSGAASPPSAAFSGRAYLIAAHVMAVLLYGFYRFQREVSTGHFKTIIAGLIGMAMVLAGPLVALSVYFGTTFAGGIVLPGIPVSVNQVVGLGVLAAWGLWIVAGRTSWPGGGYLWLLVGSSVYFVLNAILGEDREAGLQFAKYIALYELLAFVLLTSLRRPAHWRFWFWMVLLFTALNAWVGLMEFVTHRDFFPGGSFTVKPLVPARINGLSQNAIMFAYNSLWALGPGIYLALEEQRPWRRMLAGGITLFIVLMALLTYNRQTPIVLLVMVGTGVLLLRHRIMPMLTLILIVLCVLLSPYIVVKMGERLTNVGYAVKDPSYGLRRDKSRILINMTRERPLTGVGLGSFPTVWPKYIPENLWFLGTNRPSIQYPDMGYFQMLGESGFIGLGLDALLMGSGALVLLRRRRRALAARCFPVVNLCAVLAMLGAQLVISQMIQDTFFFPRSLWLFGMIVVVSAYPDERLVHVDAAPTGEGVKG